MRENKTQLFIKTVLAVFLRKERSGTQRDLFELTYICQINTLRSKRNPCYRTYFIAV